MKMFRNSVIAVLMSLVVGSTLAGSNCKLKEEFPYSKYLSKNAGDVLDRSMNSGEGNFVFDFWEIDQNSSFFQKLTRDSNFESIVFLVAKSGKNARGKISGVIIYSPKIFANESLFNEYFQGCSDKDARIYAIELSKNVCLNAGDKNKPDGPGSSNFTIWDKKVSNLAFGRNFVDQCGD